MTLRRVDGVLWRSRDAIDAVMPPPRRLHAIDATMPRCD